MKRSQSLFGVFPMCCDVALLATVSTVLFGVFARHYPDPHHDGFILAPAIGVSEGKIMHRELYSHYGPITSWINGAWLWATEPALLSLRQLGTFQLTLTAVVLYVLLVRLHMTRRISWLISLVWIISCPVWAYESGFFGLWLWPSVTFNLVALTCGLLFLQRATPPDGGTLWSIRNSLLGCFLGLASLIRTKEGLVLLAMFLLALALNRGFAGFLQGVAGIVAIFVLFGAALFSTRSFSEWISQSITGPLLDAGSVVGGGFSWTYFQSIYFAENVFRTALVFVILLALIFAYGKNSGRRVFRISILILTVVLGHLVLLRTYSYKKLDVSMAYLYPARSNLTHTLLIRLSLLLTLVGIASMAVTTIWRFLVSQRPSRIQDRELLVTLSLAVTAVSNLYPLPDIYHLWWASPSLLVFVVVNIRRSFGPQFRSAAINVFVCFALATIPLNAIKAVKDLQVPTTRWSDGALKGMLIHEYVLPSYTEASGVLKKITQPADFTNCRDPLWAVFTGRYISETRYFANVPNSSQVLRSGLLVDCGQRNLEIGSEWILREVAKTADFPTSFSTFSTLDRITVLELKDTQKTGND